MSIVALRAHRRLFHRMIGDVKRRQTYDNCQQLPSPTLGSAKPEPADKHTMVDVHACACFRALIPPKAR
jgi:hypothetical protein